MTPEDSLYQLPPDEFIAARDRMVDAARKAGDRRRAAALTALRKPTVAAWLVNLLAQQRAEQLAELLDLGELLHTAHQELRGDQLRELSAQRREAVAALVAEVARLAAAANEPGGANQPGGADRAGDADRAGKSGRMGKLPLAEVEATLTAAVADSEVADAVRAGRLTKAAGYAGFGETPRPQLRVIRGGGRPEWFSADPAGKPGLARRLESVPGVADPDPEPADTDRDEDEDDGPSDAKAPGPRAVPARDIRRRGAGWWDAAQPGPVAGDTGKDVGPRAAAGLRKAAGPRPATGIGKGAGSDPATGTAGAAGGRAARGPAPAGGTQKGGGPDKDLGTRKKDARGELERATAAERDAARVLAEVAEALHTARERHAEAQSALREAKLRRKGAERAVQRLTDPK